MYLDGYGYQVVARLDELSVFESVVGVPDGTQALMGSAPGVFCVGFRFQSGDFHDSEAELGGGVVAPLEQLLQLLHHACISNRDLEVRVLFVPYYL